MVELRAGAEAFRQLPEPLPGKGGLPHLDHGTRLRVWLDDLRGDRHGGSAERLLRPVHPLRQRQQLGKHRPGGRVRRFPLLHDNLLLRRRLAGGQQRGGKAEQRPCKPVFHSSTPVKWKL